VTSVVGSDVPSWVAINPAAINCKSAADRFGRSGWRMLHSSMAALWFGLNTPLDGRQRPDEVRACDALYSVVACYR
jgi:hypothetical protein